MPNRIGADPDTAQRATAVPRRERRERRIAARRQQILAAAEVVFAAKGYRGATTKEIAQAADVSEGTLYNYFTSKRDLFIGLMTERTDELVSSIAGVRADSVDGVMVELLASQFTRMRTHRHFRLFLQEARSDPDLNHVLAADILPRISQQVEQIMGGLIAAGVMRPINPEMANWTLLGAVVGLALFTDLGAAPVLRDMTPEEIAVHVSDIFINGLGER